MADDTAALVVALSAQLTQFEKNLDSAGDYADRKVKYIEGRFKAANISVPGLDELQSKLTALATGAGIAAVIDQFTQLNAAVAKIGETAERVGLPTDELQQFRYAVVATGGSLDAADNFLDTFSRKIAEAATGTGALYNFLRVNNVALKDSNGQLLPLSTLLAKYADLVKNTGSAQERLNEVFLVGGRSAGPQLVSALSQGSDGLRNLGAEASRSGAVIDREVIARARQINTEFEKLKLTLQVSTEELAVGTWDILARSISNVSSGLSEFISQFEFLQKLKETAANAQTGLGGGLTDVPGVGVVPNQTPGAPVPRVVVAVPVASTPLPKAAPGEQATGDNTTRQYNAQSDAFQKLIAAQQHRVDLLAAERQSIGLTIGQETELKTKLDLEAQARQGNIALTPARLAAIDAEAKKAGAAAQALDDYKRQWQGINSAAQFAGDQAIDVLDGLRTGTLTAADAVNQLANALIHAAEQALLLGQGPLAGVFGTASNVTGGTGGIIGAFISGARASGGPVDAGSAYLVGENGPELFVPKNSGTIVPNSVASHPATGGITVVVNSAPVFQAGMTPTDIAAIETRLQKNNSDLRRQVQSDLRTAIRNDADTLMRYS